MPASCVCVTGSTRGIGRAIARAFVQSGARVVVNSHLDDDEGTIAELSPHGECHFVQADLATVAGARGLVEQAQARLGRIDTLVCNAGTFRDRAFLDVEEADFDATFSLNVKGQLFAAQAFARQVVPAQEGASIICIGSTNGLQAERDSVLYDASKGAVLMLVRSLALSLAPRGIRVNGIGPGLIDTPLTAPALDAPGVRARLGGRIPLGRVGMPDDIGALAVFLAAPAAGYVTGQMLYADGGITAEQISWGNDTGDET